MPRVEIFIDYSPPEITSSLMEATRSYDLNKDSFKKIGLRNVPQDMKLGLDYLKLSYREYVQGLNALILEASIVEHGIRCLSGLGFLRDLTNTHTYLMKNPDVMNTKRFKASSNVITKFEFMQPYYTADPRLHGCFEETASTLGHIANETHLNSKYLYCIAELYGQVHFMERLEEIPNESVFESHKEEIKLFESQINEELDTLKIKYKLYDIKDGKKILRNFETIEVTDGYRKTTKLIECSKNTIR